MTRRTAAAEPMRPASEPTGGDGDPGQTHRAYEPLLPEFFPVKLVGAFISVDFVVGSSAPFRLAAA